MWLALALGERAQLVLKPRSKIAALQRGGGDPEVAVSAALDSSTLTEAPKSVVGTCQVVEKNFYRLTEEPDPGDVRCVVRLTSSSFVLEIAAWWVGSRSGGVDGRACALT